MSLLDCERGVSEVRGDERGKRVCLSEVLLNKGGVSCSHSDARGWPNQEIGGGSGRSMSRRYKESELFLMAEQFLGNGGCFYFDCRGWE